MNLFDFFSIHHKNKKKLLGVLLDPDKAPEGEQLKTFILNCEKAGVDIFLAGGSLITKGNLDLLIQSMKQITKLPVIIFPGDSSQISNEADGILLLSLISGRNPEYLIGQHVASASRLKQSKLQILPTGYLLIESGTVTTAQYVSNTVPLPPEKPEIAANTALAGELLGMKLIYMDAGSGAERCITEECIMAVRNTISIPLIIGGGINSIEKANAAWNAGADMVVVGTLFEKQPGAITLFSKR